MMLRILAALALLAIAGCAGQPPPRPTYAQLTYGHLPPFTFEASGVEVVDERAPRTTTRDASDLAPAPPAQALRQWVTDRIKANGRGPRTIRVVIKDGTILEDELPRTEGLRGMFTLDQVQRFTARAELAVEVRGERGFRDAFATASAERSTTVSEKASVNDRERILFSLVEDLMRDLNGRMDENIRAYLSPFLR
jgi:hypothetical protein